MTIRCQTTWVIFILLLTHSNLLIAGPVSDLKKDETLVFFNTSAWYDGQTEQWYVPIHGWVYEPEDSKVRKSLIAKALETAYDLKITPKNKGYFAQRVNLLLADNERGKSIVIRFADRTYALPKSKSNGHFSRLLVVDDNIIKQARTKNKLLYQAVLKNNDSRVYTGQVNLVSPSGWSIISDIDDTVKISEVTERKKLMNHTFYQEFEAVSGMAKLYNKWLQSEGALHFVSSSPWQLYPELAEFIDQAQFPSADYGLKSFRFKDSSLLNLFAKSTETKPPQIIQQLKRYPQRKFILVGDSGELDPEIYAKIQQQYPTQIKQILIRNVTDESPNSLRFQTLFKDLDPDLWQLFNSVDEIRFTP